MKIHPNSTMINSYAYDEETQTLDVEFTSGSGYSYSGVPEHVFQEMQSAPSVGRYFLQNIKGQY